MNADLFDGVLRREFPVPDEAFSRAKWMGDAADACSALTRFYRREEASLISGIREFGLSSDSYALEEVYRPYARVDVSLLRKNEPEVFEACVHVRQAFAEKVLGRRRLYDLVREAAGDVSEHEVVTVSDVRRMLPAATAARYIVDDDEFVRLCVVEQGEK